MIELKHVTFGYNKRQAVLEDINTKIHDGENVGILEKVVVVKVLWQHCY